MALRSYKNEDFPFSSTPIQSLEDSGYCGSVPRRNICVSNAKVLSTCSPITENVFKRPKNAGLQHESIASQTSQTNNALEHENITKFKQVLSAETSQLAGPDFSCSHELQNSTSQDFPIASELDSQYSLNFFSLQRENWDSSDSFSNSYDIRYSLFGHETKDLAVSNLQGDSKHSPCLSSTKSCTNYKEASSLLFKQPKIDFISEFKMREITSLISTILSCLSPEELCKASCVSKDWNQAILRDKWAKSRKETFITQKVLFLTGPAKENRLGMRCGPAREHKMAFSNVTNTFDLNEDISDSRFESKFDSFINNGSAKLRKCPICHHASKLQSGRTYMCTNCSHRFCFECLSPVLNFNKHTCYKSKLPKIIIGSKQSKKNLKRL